MSTGEGIGSVVKLKAGGFNPGILEARGLTVHERLDVSLRPETFLPLIDFASSVELVPGEETPVTLAVPGLPRNADVKSIRVRLTVSSSGQTPQPETTAVTVTSGSGAAASSQAFGVSVAPSPLPRNVGVRLEGGEELWAHGGTLPAGEHELPDIAAAANAYLDAARLPADSPTTLVFLVRSETPGRIRMSLVAGSLEYSVLETQTWPNPLDGSVRIDRNLTLGFGDVVRIPLDARATTARDALALTTVRLDVSGDAGPERLLGDVPVPGRRSFATVSSEYAVAQRVTLTTGLGFSSGSAVRVAGVATAVEIEAAVELYVEIRHDASDAPGGEVLGGVDLELEPPTGETALTWAYAALAEPAELAVDRPHWVVLRGIRGSARLALADAPGGYLSALRVNRGGQLWRPLTPGGATGPAAQLRLTYLPEPDAATAPVTIALEGREEQRPELTSQAERLTLAAGGGAAPGAIVVRSHARGNLTLANVVQEFARPGARR